MVFGTFLFCFLPEADFGNSWNILDIFKEEKSTWNIFKIYIFWPIWKIHKNDEFRKILNTSKIDLFYLKLALEFHEIIWAFCREENSTWNILKFYIFCKRAIWKIPENDEYK
jgi:hypothetical protein